MLCVWLRSTAVLGFLLAAGAIASPASEHVPFILAEESRNSLPLADSVVLDTFLSEAAAALPPSMKAALATTRVQIELAQLDDLPRVEPPVCPGTPVIREATGKPARATVSVFGRTRKAFFRNSFTIDLNRNLISEIIRGPADSTPYPCGHKTLYRLALATLVHELAHVYDSLNVPATRDPERTEREKCQDWEKLGSSGLAPNERCEYFKTATLSVSNRLPYRNLMNWKNGTFSRAPKNKLHLRSPDPYEYASLEENFAVNMEYFLLDEEFRCRRPELFGFLSQHFGFVPDGRCEFNTQVRMTTSYLPLDLDPSRVYAIHYLLADPGKDLSSRFGHAMFRIVMCSPERETVGPECIQDIRNHVVVSYRANASGVTLSYLTGVLGGYPSQLFLYSMSEIVTEYTVGEGRSIRSVPLKLSADEIKRFIHRTLEQYWEYEGRYYFFGNNCATESLDFLKSSTQEKRRVQETDFVVTTPIGLYDTLKSQGLLDDSVLNGADSRGRYLFPSFRDLVSKAFEMIRTQPGIPRDLTLDDYFRNYNAKDRRALYQSILNPRGTSRAALALQFYTMEVMIREFQNQYLRSRAGKLYEEAKDGKRISPEYRVWLEALSKERERLLPWNLVTSGYGIPSKSENRDPQELESIAKTIMDLTQKIVTELRSAEKDLFLDMDEVSENIRFFLAEVKSGIKTENGETL